MDQLEVANAILDACEAGNRALLYKARWDEFAAGEIVPKLVSLLAYNNRNVLLRTFQSLVTIGPLAKDAANGLLPHIHSNDQSVFVGAVIALGCVALREPFLAVKPLAAAFGPGKEKPVLTALLGFGPAAKSTADLFVRAFENRSATIRRLALRGLHAIQADPTVLREVLERAKSDRSSQVRVYAAKLMRQRGPASSRDHEESTGK